MFVRCLASGAACSRLWGVVGAALLAAGCTPSLNNPERLTPVTVEMTNLTASQAALVDEYYAALRRSTFERARIIRNEIIAQRMYAVDVQYSQYEASLTRESQQVGFAAVTTAEGLTTASTLVVPAATKSILSALATAVLATRGHYNSEILLAQTMRTIQKQMRASRAKVATQISARMAQSVADYPLSEALGEVEEYYRAGTLTSGLIDTSTTVGIEEDEAKKRARDIAVLPAETRLAAVLRESSIPEVRNALPLTGFRPKGVDPQRVFEQRVDAALCVQLTGQGRNEAIRDYLIGRRQVAPDTGSVTLTPRFRTLVNRALNVVRDCRQTVYLNAFEVGRYGVAPAGVRSADIEALQRALNVPVTRELDKPTRDAIEALRRQKGLRSSPGGGFDGQIDNALLNEIFG
jgi:hypothetical protein